VAVDGHTGELVAPTTDDDWTDGRVLGTSVDESPDTAGATGHRVARHRPADQLPTARSAPRTDQLFGLSVQVDDHPIGTGHDDGDARTVGPLPVRR
jgi:hypothetical protein